MANNNELIFSSFRQHSDRSSSLLEYNQLKGKPTFIVGTTHTIPKEWIDLKNKGVIDIERRENVTPSTSIIRRKTN